MNQVAAVVVCQPNLRGLVAVIAPVLNVEADHENIIGELTSFDGDTRERCQTENTGPGHEVRNISEVLLQGDKASSRSRKLRPYQIGFDVGHVNNTIRGVVGDQGKQ
jgi:hypothetical protein